MGVLTHRTSQTACAPPVKGGTHHENLLVSAALYERVALYVPDKAAVSIVPCSVWEGRNVFDQLLTWARPTTAASSGVIALVRLAGRSRTRSPR